MPEPGYLRDRLDAAHGKRAQRVRRPAHPTPPEPTDIELLAAYEELTGDYDPGEDDRTQSILAGMREILAAPTIAEAAEVIRWWDGPAWGNHETPEGWVREYRQRFATPSPAGGEWAAAAARVSRIVDELSEIAGDLGATSDERAVFDNLFEAGRRQSHPRFAALACHLEARRIMALLAGGIDPRSTTTENDE